MAPNFVTHKMSGLQLKTPQMLMETCLPREYEYSADQHMLGNTLDRIISKLLAHQLVLYKPCLDKYSI